MRENLQSEWRMVCAVQGELARTLGKVLLMAQLTAPAASLPLKGADAVVWLEGPLRERTSIQLLVQCYVAEGDTDLIAVVCLD